MIILLGAIFVGGGLLLVTLALASGRSGATMNDPVLAAADLNFASYAAARPVEEAPERNPRQALEVFLESFNAALTRLRFASGLQEELARADLKLRAGEFFFIQLGSAALVALILYLRAGLIPGLVGIIIGYLIPGFWIRRRQSKRQKAFGNQLGDTLLLLSNALKAGYSIAQAMDTVAKSSAPPISVEFGRAVREMNLGLAVDDALRNMVRRVNSDDFDLVVTAIGIHRQVGGNLAEILDTIAYTIRERVRIKGEIRTLTAQARGSGYIITALPFALGGLLYLISPVYFRPMLADPLGWVLVGMGLFSMAIGYAIIRKIVTIEV